MDLGDPQGDGGGDLEISPLSLAIFVLMAEQERAVGKWEKERMGESAVYSMSSMDMCVYLELICICVCMYVCMYVCIYICNIHTYIHMWIYLDKFDHDPTSRRRWNDGRIGGTIRQRC